MAKKFVIIGSGWRSLFYVRIAKACPELFSLTALICRSDEKAEKIAHEEGIPTSTDVRACMDTRPDFAVVAVNKDSIYEVSRQWLDEGIPVLCETPPALHRDELRALHDGAFHLDVAEQYFLHPGYAAIEHELLSGRIGTPMEMTLSAVHDYHAASLFRRMLGCGFEDIIISGESHTTKVTETETRAGRTYDGLVVERERTRLTLEFESGKRGYYDFCPIQYRSDIRHNYLNIRGERGEIVNDTVYYLDESNHIQSEKLIGRLVCESDQLNACYRSGILSDDEYAIACRMLACCGESKAGEYSLEDGLQDAWISLCMHRAAETGERVDTRK